MQALPEGTILNNKYAVKRVLGRGCIGYVYQCGHVAIKKDFAVKEAFPAGYCREGKNVFPDGSALTRENMGSSRLRMAKENLRAEAELLFRLPSSPDLVRVYDIFEENHTVYMVMELVLGRTLREYMGSRIWLDEEQVRMTGLQLLKPLKIFQDHGLVHLDICPDNIIIGDTVRLIDYGAARTWAEERTGGISIRRGYSPGEQYRIPQRVGPWTDLYSVGAVLYELVTAGRMPEALSRENGDALVPPGKIRQDISEELNRIIMKAVSPNPAQRFQTVDEFWQALTGEEELARKTREAKTRGLVIFLAGALFWLFYFGMGVW